MIAVEVARFGDASVLAVVERPAPVPQQGEVLVRIEAVGLNWSDVMQREGTYVGGPRPPYIAGQEAAAIVVGHGPGVDAPALGTAVSVLARGGLAAELAAVPQASCFTWPCELTAHARAALPISLLTAHHALAVSGRAKAGEVALIHAAGGGLGTLAVQIAHQLGLVTIATCSEGKRAAVAALGADHVCGFDELPVVAADGVDLVLDGVGGDMFRASVALLRPFGRIVVVGAASGRLQQIDPVRLVNRSQEVIGLHLRHVVANRALVEQALAVCAPWLASGAVKPLVTTMPLAEMRRAHELLAARAVTGKLVLTL